MNRKTIRALFTIFWKLNILFQIPVRLYKIKRNNSLKINAIERLVRANVDYTMLQNC